MAERKLGIKLSISSGCQFQMLPISCRSTGKVWLTQSHNPCWISQWQFLLHSESFLVWMWVAVRWVNSV